MPPRTPAWILLRCALAAGCACGTAFAQSTADSAAQEYRGYSESHPYLYDQFSPGDLGTGGIDELDDVDRPETSIGVTRELDSPLSYLRGKLDTLAEKTGLRLGLAFTALGTQASGAGDPSGAAGDLDLLSAWTLVGRGTPNTGVLVATAEYRGTIGTDDPPSALGAALGTLINPVNAFNDRGWVVRDFYWLQRLFEDRLRILVGRADTGDYVGGQPMQNVNTMFVNRHFSGNPSVPFPGHGPTIGFSVRPDDRFYVTAGVANAYGNTTESELDSLDEGDFFYTAELGWTPLIEGMGRGRYSIMGWYVNERDRDTVIPSDQGLTVIAGQQLNDRLQAWGRYAYADATTTNIRQLVQGGVGYNGLFGSPSNLTGFALSYAQPRSDRSRDEKVIELFERLQLTRFTQFSVGAQAIFDPGNNPDEDLVGVFYARLRIAF